MGLFFVYILKSSICLAFFYLFYRLLLSKETFHRFNRIALMSLLLMSWVIPVVEFSVKQPSDMSQAMLTLEQILMQVDWNDVPQDAMSETAIITQADNPISWVNILLIIYFAGILFFIIRNTYSVVRLGVLLKLSRKSKLSSNITLCVHNKEISPFSWMRMIVISQQDLDENGREILIHETAHIRKYHSWDLLLADICVFFQWFNPAAWLLKQELQTIHEYQADDIVLREGVDAKQYQLLLIKKAVGTRLYSMANNLNQSNLKKRITMMLKQKSSPWARLKYLYVLPLAAIAVTAFARTEISETMNEISNAKINDLVAINETSPIETAPVSEEIASSVTASLPQDVVKVDDNDPVKKKELYTVVDGKGVTKEEMKAIDPNDIKSITVLKSQEAIAAYGDKAKNGAVVITLYKDGEKPEVNTDRSKESTNMKFIVDGKSLTASEVMTEAKGRSFVTMKADGKVVAMATTESEDNTTPLVVVDGEQVFATDLNKYNADRIKHIEVLKGEKAIAEFGEKGKNGVVIVALKTDDEMLEQQDADSLKIKKTFRIVPANEPRETIGQSVLKTCPSLADSSTSRTYYLNSQEITASEYAALAKKEVAENYVIAIKHINDNSVAVYISEYANIDDMEKSIDKKVYFE